METKVFVEKIENLVNEFTKNIDKDCMEFKGKDYQILFKKTEIINETQYGNRWGGATIKPGYNLTYCSCCGKPIYYKGRLVPTHCGNCEN